MNNGHYQQKQQSSSSQQQQQPQVQRPTTYATTGGGYVNGKRITSSPNIGTQSGSTGPIGPPPGMPPKRKPVKRVPVGGHSGGGGSPSSGSGSSQSDMHSKSPRPSQPQKLPYPTNEPDIPQVKPPFMYQESRPPMPKFPSSPMNPQLPNKSLEDLRRVSTDYRETVPLQRRSLDYRQSQSNSPPNNPREFEQDQMMTPLSRTSTSTTSNYHTPSPKYQQQLAHQQQQPQLPPHQRNDSVHSESSSASASQQPLYMNTSTPAPAPTQAPAPAPGAVPPISTNLEHQYSVSSSVYSQSSKVSHGSGSMTGKNSELGIGTGSAYVKELRKRLATAWCDVPSRAWGLPIGISGKTTSTSALGPTKNFQRRAMDIRHSHLQPRLLASEVEEDSDDGLNSPGGFSSNSAGDNNNNNAGSGLFRPSSTTSIPKDGSVPSEVSSIKDQSLDDKSQTSSNPHTTHSNSAAASTTARQRSGSGSSTKSVEEDVGKIKLFVANPDTDSD